MKSFPIAELSFLADGGDRPNHAEQEPSIAASDSASHATHAKNAYLRARVDGMSEDIMKSRSSSSPSSGLARDLLRWFMCPSYPMTLMTCSGSTARAFARSSSASMKRKGSSSCSNARSMNDSTAASAL